jgi:opine dehydrogenase
VYRHSPAPAVLAHRYLTEDVPWRAVPVASLGRKLSVDVSVTAACVDLAPVLLGRDMWAEGRAVDRPGLAGLSAAEIHERVA